MNTFVEGHARTIEPHKPTVQPHNTRAQATWNAPSGRYNEISRTIADAIEPTASTAVVATATVTVTK